METLVAFFVGPVLVIQLTVLIYSAGARLPARSVSELVQVVHQASRSGVFDEPSWWRFSSHAKGERTGGQGSSLPVETPAQKELSNLGRAPRRMQVVLYRRDDAFKYESEHVDQSINVEELVGWATFQLQVSCKNYAVFFFVLNLFPS